MKKNYYCTNCKTHAHGWDEDGNPICLTCFENAQWVILNEPDLSKYSIPEAIAIESMINGLNEYGIEGAFKKIDEVYPNPLVRASVRRVFLKAVKETNSKFELFKIEE